MHLSKQLSRQIYFIKEKQNVVAIVNLLPHFAVKNIDNRGISLWQKKIPAKGGCVFTESSGLSREFSRVVKVRFGSIAPVPLAEKEGNSAESHAVVAPQ